MGLLLQEPLTELGQLQAQLEAIDRSHCRIEFCLDGKVTDANENFLEVFGYRRDELVGQHHSMLVRRSERESEQYQEFWRVLRRGEFHRGLVERVARDSSPRWIQATYNPVFGPDGSVEKIVKYAIDVTHFKVADEISEEAGRLYRAQLAAIDRSHCRVEFDRSGYIIDANQNFLDLVGYDADELICSHHSTILFDEEAEGEAYKRFWEALRRGEFQSAEFRRKSKDGSERWIQATYNPVCNLAGRVGKVVKYAVDITEARQRRRENSDQQRLESIGTLAAGLAHEINTPMQSIVGNLEYLEGSLEKLRPVVEQLALLGDSLEDPPLSFVEKLREACSEAKCDSVSRNQFGAVEDSTIAARRVVDIIRAMKDYSHLSQVTLASVDLNQVIRQAVTITRNEWKYDAELECDLDENLPHPAGISSDICQVIVNLIINATHAICDRQDTSEPGRIEIATRTQGDSSVVFEVRDNGCGMNADTRKRLFDRFFTTKEVGRGTGQGLAITHDIIVKRHGGSISIDSEPEAGCLVRVVLPLVSAAVDGHVNG